MLNVNKQNNNNNYISIKKFVYNLTWLYCCKNVLNLLKLGVLNNFIGVLSK